MSSSLLFSRCERERERERERAAKAGRESSRVESNPFVVEPRFKRQKRQKLVVEEFVCHRSPSEAQWTVAFFIAQKILSKILAKMMKYLIAEGADVHVDWLSICSLKERTSI